MKTGNGEEHGTILEKAEKHPRFSSNGIALVSQGFLQGWK